MIRRHMMMGGNRRFALALLVAGCGLASPARGQSAADKAAAEGLFDQGRAAMREGDFNKACGLLERSQHIDPGVGTLLYLAECYEKAGRTASAWATFREAADAADAARDATRARTGRERAQRVEPHLSRLTIQVAPENQQLRGLTIERRDRQVQQALWNVPVPTDPGEYTITASAAGYETWSGAVTVPERAGRVSISIPPLKKSAEPEKAAPVAAPANPSLPAPGADKSPAEAPSSVLSVRSPDGPEKPRASGQRTAAYFLGGAGVLGVAVGSYFGVRAITKNSDLEDRCPSEPCTDAEGPVLFEDAKSAARVSNITFALGAAALVGGVVLYLTAPDPSSAAQSTRVRARVAPGGLVLEGAFQ